MTSFFKRLGDAIAGDLRAAPAEAYEMRGFCVVVENTRPDIDTASVLSRLDEALSLIEMHQPWRLAHLRRDLRRIWVVRYPCRGAYLPATRTCMTELTFLARTDITAAPVAASIVHEGMHARIDRMALRPDSYDSAREERICRRAELEFGRDLPSELGASVIQRAIESLSLSDENVAPVIDWDVAQERLRSVDAAAARSLEGPATS